MTFLRYLNYLKSKVKVTTVENILWFINLPPRSVGFSFLEEKYSVIFWVVHLVLFFYTLVLRNFILELYYADDLGKIVGANTALCFIIIALCSDHWFLTKRSVLVSTLKSMINLDRMSQENECLREKHGKVLNFVKKIVYSYYTIIYFNAYFIFMPQRFSSASAFSVPNQCPGISDTTGIGRYICRIIAVTQDLMVINVVISYQGLLIFIITYTTAMYSMLSEETLALNKIGSKTQIEERLSLIIKRHGLLLDIVKRIKFLYSMPIGINFGTNAYSMCLFFLLPLEQWIAFGPLLLYFFLIFFLYCYLCQKLIDSSIVFESSVYECGWENYDMNDKKTVLIILKLAQKPVLLQAGYMVPINIYTFAQAMQFIYKFVTALKL